MPTILIAWELGFGIGHLMNLRPIGQAFIRRGHRVIAAVRDIYGANKQWSDTGISFVQAPIMPPEGLLPFNPTRGFAHLLGNIGFGDEASLQCLFSAWDTLIDCIKPDLVVCDHSPNALLALRGKPIPRVNIGLGFFCPPEGFPLPGWNAKGGTDHSDQLAQDERDITGRVNQLLESHKRPQIEHLSQIFTEIDEVFLATYREFDHFGETRKERGSGKLEGGYWGHWPFGIGDPPEWPEASGPKVYAYLKPFPALEELLKQLKLMGLPSLVLAPAIDQKLKDTYASPVLRFVPRPLDLRRVSAECDVAILNANHGTMASILLAGKPCFLLPFYAEQFILAKCVERLGMGKVASIQKDSPVATDLQGFINNRNSIPRDSAVSSGSSVNSTAVPSITRKS